MFGLSVFAHFRQTYRSERQYQAPGLSHPVAMDAPRTAAVRYFRQEEGQSTPLLSLFYNYTGGAGGSATA